VTSWSGPSTGWGSGARHDPVLDEVHRFSKSSRRAPRRRERPHHAHRRHHREPVLRGEPAAASRSTLFRLNPLDLAAARALIERGSRPRTPRATTTRSPPGQPRQRDGRHVLTSLEGAVAIAAPGQGTGASRPSPSPTPRRRLARRPCATAATSTRRHLRLHQEHPGSDPTPPVLAGPDAGGREDARFIARRIVILASEDVGEADPMGLVVAVAAAHAVEHFGLPERSSTSRRPWCTWPPPQVEPRGHGDLERRETSSTAVGGGAGHLRDAHYFGAERSWARGGLRLSSRPPGRLGAAAVPARRGAGPHVLRALRPRLRAGDPHAHGTQVRPGDAG